MKNLKVVCGIIEKDNQILIGKKIECEHPIGLGGKWHFPGGRVEEEGEDLESALKREIKEETNLEIELKEKIGSSINNTKDISAEIICFTCIPKNLDFSAGDDLEELKWVSRDKVLKEIDDRFVNSLSEDVINYLSNKTRYPRRDASGSNS